MPGTAWESRWLPEYNLISGGVAQLGEHLPCKQGVKSSNLSVSIRMHVHPQAMLHLEKSIQTERDFLFDEMQRKTEEAERERKAWAWPMHGAGMTLHAVRRDRSSRKGTGRMPWH